MQCGSILACAHVARVLQLGQCGREAARSTPRRDAVRAICA